VYASCISLSGIQDICLCVERLNKNTNAVVVHLFMSCCLIWNFNIHLTLAILHVQLTALNNEVQALQRDREILKTNLNKAEEEVLDIEALLSLCFVHATFSVYINLWNTNVALIVKFCCVFPSRLSCYSRKTELLTKQTRGCWAYWTKSRNNDLNESILPVIPPR
jgi:hypothetical protein